MKEQLLGISFDATRSACCDQNHVGAQRVLRCCVTVGWWKNVWEFGLGVKKRLKMQYAQKSWTCWWCFLSDKVFTNTWILSVTTPFVWTFLDLSVSFAPFPHPFWEHTSVALLTEGLVLWLLAFPSVKDLLIMFLHVDTGKREDAMYWNLQEPDGGSDMCPFSEHPLGALCCNSVCGISFYTCSCLVRGRCGVFHCLASQWCCCESDPEAPGKRNITLALKGWVCTDFPWRNT